MRFVQTVVALSTLVLEKKKSYLSWTCVWQIICVFATRRSVLLRLLCDTDTHRMLMNSKRRPRSCGGLQSVPKTCWAWCSLRTSPAHCWNVSKRAISRRFLPLQSKPTCRESGAEKEHTLFQTLTHVCVLLFFFFFFFFQQKYLLSNPAHQSCAVDEHFFLNESAAQVRYAWLCWRHVRDVRLKNDLQPLPLRDITKFKPLSSKTTVTVITGDRFDREISDQLNQVRRRHPRAVVSSACVETHGNPFPPHPHLHQMVAALQKKFLEASYPSANRIHIKGADRQMIHTQPSAVIQHLRRLVNQRQAKQQSQWPTGRRPTTPQTEQSARMSEICRKWPELSLYLSLQRSLQIVYLSGE